jgi:hypothetical protein
MDATGRQQTYTTRVIRENAELESIKPLWERLQKHANADFDVYVLVARCRPSIVRPHVVIVSEEGSPVSLIVARIEDRRIECTVGYATLYRPMVRIITILHGGWMGEQSPQVADVIVRELMDALAHREADAVYANLYPDDSPLHEAARRHPSFLCRNHVVTSQPHFQMQLPPLKSDLYKNMHRKHRAAMRKKVEMIRRDHPDQVVLRRFRNADEVAQLCTDAEAIERKTYHRGLGIGFRNDPETQQVLSAWAGKGRLVSYVLYVDGVPWSFAIGKTLDSTCYLDYVGYDPAHAGYTPGIALLTALFEDLCDDHSGVTVVDFGFGDADYKRRFCTISWQESSTYIFAQRPRPVFINMVRVGILQGSTWLKKLGTKMNLESMVKKLWRKKAAEKQEE